MWFDSPRRYDDVETEQDERYPYYPVATGNPLTAALSVLLVLGLIAATFLVTL